MIRTAVVWGGGNGGFRTIYGLEAEMDYSIGDCFFIALRAAAGKKVIKKYLDGLQN